MGGATNGAAKHVETTAVKTKANTQMKAAITQDLKSKDTSRLQTAET